MFTDKTLAKNKKRTKKFLSIISENDALQPHWHVYTLLIDRGLTPNEANDLMTKVSIESILYRPFKYGYHTVRLFFRYLFLEPDRLIRNIKKPAILPYLYNLIKPVITLLVYFTSHWIIGFLAVLGIISGIISRSHILCLASTLAVLYLILHAAGEWQSLRFGIPVYPLLSFLACWGMIYGGCWLKNGDFSEYENSKYGK